MIGKTENCGSCIHFVGPKILTGYCGKKKYDVPIYGTCEDYTPEIIHKNEVLECMWEDEE